MHVFLLGLLKDATKSTIGMWTDTTRSEFEILTHKIVDDDHSSSGQNQFLQYPLE